MAARKHRRNARLRRLEARTQIRLRGRSGRYQRGGNVEPQRGHGEPMMKCSSGSGNLELMVNSPITAVL